MSGSNRQRAAQRPQMSSRSAAAVMTARSGSPPQSGTAATVPAGQVASRHHGVARARQERPHRLLEHGLQPFEFRAHRTGARTARPRTTCGRCPGARRPAARGLPPGDGAESSSASWFRMAVAVARSRNRRSLQSTGRCSNCRIGPVGEQAIQIGRLEPDGRQRHARLDPALQLEQLDLEIGGRRKVGLILFQSPQLDDFAGLRPGGGRRRRDLRFAHAPILAELDSKDLRDARTAGRTGPDGRAKLSVCVTLGWSVQSGMADENPEKKVRKRQPVKKAETKKTAKKAETRIRKHGGEPGREGREEGCAARPRRGHPRDAAAARQAAARPSSRGRGARRHAGRHRERPRHRCQTPRAASRSARRPGHHCRC